MEQVQTIVSYEVDGSVSRISMDDGKVNVLSPTMLAQLESALDAAQRDGNVVVLSGRDGIFSGGFDLKVLRGGGPDAVDMLRSGFDLAVRLLTFPFPVVAACPGHAVAMASFLLLSADYRIGVAGPYRIVANEVAIGMTMPRAAVEICRQRLTPSHFNRAVNLAETFSPEDAVTAGFLDRVVPPDELPASAMEVANQLSQLDLGAHAASKSRLRAASLEAIRAGYDQDFAELGLPG
jgi:enoyl-CoA hydratase